MKDTPSQDRGAVIFELCAETVQACRVARGAGVARIEFCADLAVEGLTPSPELTRSAVAESGLPVYMLLRPRAGDFVYAAEEFARMKSDLLAARALGVAGFALGVLLSDGRVDKARTRELVELAAPLGVTFHRAFDATPDLPQALEDVIETGCHRVLTSGGAADVTAGSEMLAQLVRQATGRIEIAAGGGVRADTAERLARLTGGRHFHGSLRHRSDAPKSVLPKASGMPLGVEIYDDSDVDPETIRDVIDALERGRAEYLAT